MSGDGHTIDVGPVTVGEAADHDDYPPVENRPTNEYLRFEENPPEHGRKTKVVIIRAARTSTVLGRIGWWGSWRQYTFFPEGGTVFNQGCLTTINAYMAALMEERHG